MHMMAKRSLPAMPPPAAPRSAPSAIPIAQPDLTSAVGIAPIGQQHAFPPSRRVFDVQRELYGDDAASFGGSSVASRAEAAAAAARLPSREALDEAVLGQSTAAISVLGSAGAQAQRRRRASSRPSSSKEVDMVEMSSDPKLDMEAVWSASQPPVGRGDAAAADLYGAPLLAGASAEQRQEYDRARKARRADCFVKHGGDLYLHTLEPISVPPIEHGRKELSVAPPQWGESSEGGQGGGGEPQRKREPEQAGAQPPQEAEITAAAALEEQPAKRFGERFGPPPAQAAGGVRVVPARGQLNTTRSLSTEATRAQRPPTASSVDDDRPTLTECYEGVLF